MSIKKISIIISAVFVLLLATLLSSCIPFRGFGEEVSTSAVSTAEPAMAPDFTLLDLDNNKVSLSDFKGKVVVLNFWATWCPPCKAELPDFVEVSDSYKDKDVQFLGVSDDDISALKQFAIDYKIEYPTLLDGSADTIMPVWQISAIPTTFIINREGEITYKNVGMISKDMLIKAIELNL